MSKNVYLISINTDSKFIYITDEGKIKDGEYGLCAGLVRQGFKSEQAVFRMDDEQREAMVDLGGQKKAEDLKVLLTNDPRLIADGVQEIEKSVLISFAENPVDYVEVIDLYGSNLYINMGNLPRYSVNLPQKEHQMLTDLKDYFKNTSPEKIQSDWEETKQKSPKKLEEKDWARFERFVVNRAEENKTAEKLYTEEQLFQCWKASSTADISEESMRVHFEEWKRHLNK